MSHTSNKFLGKKQDLVKLPTFEFHVSKECRQKYNFDDEIFSITGNVVFTNNNAVRKFTQKLNEQRSENNKVKVSQIYSTGLLDEIFHFLLREYEEKENPGVFSRAVENLTNKLGEDSFRRFLFEFVSIFPPKEVYHGKSSIFEYLNSYTGNKQNIELVIEELILLYLANFNPANKNIIELFDEKYFKNQDEYKLVIEQLNKFFLTEKAFGPENQDVFTLLKAPILNNPDSVEAQLEFIKEKWAIIIEDKFADRILLSRDLIKEEIIVTHTDFGGGGGAPTVVPHYKFGDNFEQNAEVFLGKSLYNYSKESKTDYEEPEKFTNDLDWMPQIVILAKNTYVWLDQLSKKYQRKISKLNEVPDAELDTLANWHFTGLWLIGVWERSSASQKIKHVMGNGDAISSAYSLYDYTIAADLGGEAAYEDLNRRALARGIRLASDMVPNHTGVYSKWIVEHPEYFIQRKDLPYANYKFTGINLSDNPEIDLKIEDGYWSKSDAAVVFRRIDNRTGDVTYVYHGNDGTNMPWNDTAQLDMLKKDVREAVIQQIFSVAKRFSIIRFDAAMTLAKKHFARLWYPQPGKGGDIPTRADYALTRDTFDELFPEEFWREVVDRINNEMPNTLLLAEAFWLLEGYFVRSLGMHRVYNSAFMHMLMKEENEKYRDLITNTLEFEPEILKRYVNFMSNPDEETAIKQFGIDDKYFGVSTMLLTLPGLPMFGHGQIEGFTEKYGMEYKRAYYNESPNGLLVERHERELFPLMNKRYLFSQVTDFWFYDFIDGHGVLNENVFAYSNMAYGERAIIFYNNKFKYTAGKIYKSTPKLVVDGENKLIKAKTIFETLNFNISENYFYIYREHVSNLYYIKEGKDFFNNGFEIELDAFKYKVFIEFKEVYDTSGEYRKLAKKIGTKGVVSIENALNEINLEPIHEALENMFEEKMISIFVNSYINTKTKILEDDTKFLRNKFYYFINKIKDQLHLQANTHLLLDKFESKLLAVKKINNLFDDLSLADRKFYNKKVENNYLLSRNVNYKENSLLFLIWLTIDTMREMFPGKGEINIDNFINKLLFDSPVKSILKRLGRGTSDIYKEVALLNLLLEYDGKLFVYTDDEIEKIKIKIDADKKNVIHMSKGDLLKKLFSDDFIKAYLGVNYYEDVWYYSKENFEELIDWFFTGALITYASASFAKNSIEGIKSQEIAVKVTAETINLPIEMSVILEKISYLRFYISSLAVKSEYKFEELKELMF
ncbi:MAG: alpha-amylase family glycosyl hydrolase [bacterium]